ncbi:hypothetical protein BBO_00628 [Beauveria brongniartii RCEF 3172]|uniref:DUF2828 domain-containing protein n=1 Tax=Beauveria brongniartii RCEF 3172 TaxID=1081107 RepID=A0A167L8R6_9HYPO|nr:hypothetical protein BBO_00628 [Beauveria brongniartii RCEF 3172]
MKENLEPWPLKCIWKWLKPDPFGTLKLIFELVASIRVRAHATFPPGRWLAMNHPYALATNLSWLSREIQNTNPIEVDSEIKVVHTERKGEDDGPSRFKVLFGVSPGYRKYVLNILVLQVRGELKV